MPRLYEIRGQLNDLYERAFDESDDDGLIPANIAKAMQAAEMAFDEKVENALYLIRSWESDELGYKIEEERLAKQRQRIARRREALKDYIKAEMEAVGKDKIRGVILSARLQRNSQPSVQVVDEAKIPDKFFRIIREVDKRAIVDATKAAEQVDGVVVETGKHLRITE
jgi:hypothetical protein